MHFWDKVNTFDASLFVAINHAGIPLFDPFMRLVSDRMTWWFVGTLVTIMVAVKRSRRIWSAWILILFTIGVSDAFTFYVLKECFQRVRPCLTLPVVRLVQGYCGGRYGFPSNHASTGMAISFVSWYLFRSAWIGGIFFGALLVGFSRIYLGVHYPGDILGGFFEGAILGTCLYYAFRLLARRFPTLLEA